MKLDFNSNNLKPFLLVAVLWLALTSALVLGVFIAWPTEASFERYLWYFGYFFGCIVNLILVAKVVAQTLHVVSERSKTKNPKVWFQVGTWVVIKMAWLVLFMSFVYLGRDNPPWILLTGLSTIVGVPFLGGMLWSQSLERTED